MVLYGSLNIKTKNMKYIVIFILGLLLFVSCDKNEPRFICVCANLVDNYPKGAKHLDYSREITYVLKFRNGSKDSIFFPFYGIYGWGDTKSAFYIKYKGFKISCDAKFWGYQHNTHIVGPGEYTRIGINIWQDQLENLHIAKNVDIEDLEKMITVCYKYDSRDKVPNHLKAPKIEVKNYGTVELLYGRRYAPEPGWMIKRKRAKWSK